MQLDASALVTWLGSLELVGAQIFLVAVLLDACLVRRSAAVRRGIWALAFAVALVLPLTRLALPTPAQQRSDLLAASLLALWATGALLLLVRLLRGHLLARQRLARSVPIADASWLAELAGRRGVELRLSDETDSPQTVGALRPTILVPRRMLELPASERRALLAHELAHVARADCLLLLAGAVVRALYWITPLPWWALRSLRARAEDAADDAALGTGIRSSSYAAQLLAVARKRLERAGQSPGAGLKTRVRAILDARRVRSREPRWSVAVLVGVAASIATMVTACEARSAPEPACEACPRDAGACEATAVLRD
jgi:beta-lactamase regulating signal transducer with metallopeptidase domain